MRPYYFIAALILSATPALAQQYPAQTSYPQQEASVVGYPQVPTTYPQPVYVAPEPVQQPAQVYYPPATGHSVVMTDVRQMNF